jgi:tetratricopeptide (TPR) repeat protein
MIQQRGKTCAGVAIILSLSLACGRSASYYVDKGKQFRAQGKLEEAALNFQKALQKDSRNGAAYLELGGIYLQQKKGAEAYRALFRAVELLPENEEAKRELADVCLAGYMADPNRPKHLYGQIVELSGKLLARNPESFDGHRLKGYLCILDRSPDQALEHLRKANEIKPNEPRVIQALTQVLFTLHQPGEAEETALQLVEKQKDFGPIYDILYRYYESSQRASEAEQLIKSKAANNPKNVSFTLQLAAHYARMKNRDAMAATLQRLLDAPGDFPDARLQVGDFYLALGEPDQARRYYEQGIQSNPAAKTDYQKRLVMLLVAQGQGIQGLPILEEILKAKPDDVSARAARASLLLEKPAAADRERAAAEFQDLVAKNPQDANLHYGLGRALGVTAKPDLARKQFAEAIALRPAALPPRFALAELALRRKDYSEVLKESGEILQLRPGDPRARLIRASGLSGTGALAEASQELKQLLLAMPNFADAELQLGYVYLAQKKFSEAEVLFRKYSKPGAASLRATEGLAQVYWLQNQPQKALDIWKREAGNAPQPPARLGLAAAALRAGQPDAAIEQYEALVALDPKSGSVRQLLGLAYRLKGDDATAIASFQKAIELDPNDPHAPLALGDLLQKTGRTQEAVPLYRRVLQLQPNDPAALNNLAFLLSETGGNLDEALQLALQAQRLMAGQPNVADTVGWIYVKQNMPGSAVQIFRTLVKKNPDKATYHYHLGAALLLKGDKAAAKTELQVALQKSPSKQEEQKIRELLNGA